MSNQEIAFLGYIYSAVRRTLFMMAAPVRSSDISVPTLSGQSTAASGAENAHLHYSVLLDHLIGDKRQIKDLNPGVMGGLPTPHKTDEQKMIERGMESCAFKATLACVGGKEINSLVRNKDIVIMIHFCMWSE